ncbi:RAMP superfamily CRISPR-associated protein, partial [Vibrio parahaemolyticus]|nr:RAMP superfamily CRISPR-associated protein [Vibrio parahaemolyticus]
INKYNVGDISNNPHREKLFTDDIVFFNAYPKAKDKRSFPLPKCFFAPKAEMKMASDYLNLELGIDNKLKPLYEKVRLCEFVVENGDTLNKVKIEKESHLHINKNTPKNKLYRYETIKRGQTFSGIIKTVDDYEEEIVNLLKDSIVYIGGSKGSGYGKCKIENLKVSDENPEATLSNLNVDKDFYV